MATYQETVQDTVSGAVSAVAGESDAVKSATAMAAVQAAAMVPPPEGRDVGVLWKMLIGGLLAVLLVSLAGIVWSVMDDKTGTTSDVLVTIFTATLTALIGLFAKSPTQ